MEKLKESVEYLNSIHIPICTEHGDGRVNSVEDEKTIIDLMVDRYGDEITETEPRSWTDVIPFGFPTNIKSTGFKGADNFSSKSAVLYALTNLSIAQILKITKWHDFQVMVREHGQKENNRDYQIIVLNKKTNKVYLTSLKRLNKLTPNGNNLLFQIPWKDNTVPVERTHKEAYDFLIGAYKDSVAKKVGVHAGYETL